MALATVNIDKIIKVTSASSYVYLQQKLAINTVTTTNHALHTRISTEKTTFPFQKFSKVIYISIKLCQYATTRKPTLYASLMLLTHVTQ